MMTWLSRCVKMRFAEPLRHRSYRYKNVQPEVGDILHVALSLPEPFQVVSLCKCESSFFNGIQSTGKTAQRILPRLLWHKTRYFFDVTFRCTPSVFRMQDACIHVIVSLPPKRTNVLLRKEQCNTSNPCGKVHVNMPDKCIRVCGQC